jgi:hypothetical protein
MRSPKAFPSQNLIIFFGTVEKWGKKKNLKEMKFLLAVWWQSIKYI